MENEMNQEPITLDDFYESYEPYITEFKVGDFDLNFNHYLDIGKSSNFSNLGIKWLLSVENTGHDHIVIIPRLHTRFEDWPIAYYDETEGIAETFASSIKTWLPNYLIFTRDYEYLYESILACKSEIAQKLKLFYSGDCNQFIDMILDKNVSKSKIYELLRPNSFLHEYWLLKERNTSVDEWKEYCQKFPFYNRPFLDQFNNGKMDYEMMVLYMDRNLRYDLGINPFHILEGISDEMLKRYRGPFLTMLERISHNRTGYYEAARGYYEAGRYYEKAKDHILAITCYENAIFSERKETEKFHEDAFSRLIQVSKIVHDKSYLSYLEEALDTDMDNIQVHID